MILQDNLELDVWFDDFKYPMDRGNISFTIVENATEYLPLLQMSVVDNDAMIGAPSVSDGMLVKIVIGDPRTGYSQTISFRVFTYMTEGALPGQGTDELMLSGYMDYQDIFKVCRFSATEGKSGAAAKALADENGLQTDIDPSTDNQVWLRAGLSGGSYLKHLSSHAYKDDLSAFVSTITRQGVLRYYNLTDQKKKEAAWTFTQNPTEDGTPQTNTIYFSQPKYTSHSGFMNQYRGYGFFASEYSIMTGEKTDVYADKASKSTDHLAVNADLTEASRYISAPVNCGNTHKKYFQAEVQNERNLALFSTDLTFTTTVLKDTAILDRAKAIVSDDRQNTLRQPMSGDYFITKIVTEVENSELRIHYTLTREGFNSSDSNTGKSLR